MPLVENPIFYLNGFPVYSDRHLAELELCQDVVYGRLTPDEKDFYVEKALIAGSEAARQFSHLREGNITNMAEQLGCRIRFEHRYHKVAGVLIRAEYYPVQKEIVVYKESVEEIASLLADVIGDQEWTLKRVEEIHIAHELFHHLETTRLGLVNEQLPRVVTFRWGSVIRRTSVRRTREIAAHKFAKDILNLPFLPNNIDLFLVLNRQNGSDVFHPTIR